MTYEIKKTHTNTVPFLKVYENEIELKYVNIHGIAEYAIYARSDGEKFTSEDELEARSQLQRDWWTNRLDN